MKVRALLLSLAAFSGVRAQTFCPPTPTYTPCDLLFEMSAEETAAHPVPYTTVSLEAEFRSPRFRTHVLPGFWDGGSRLVVRFTPTEPGAWDFRLTSNLSRLNGQRGQVQATASGTSGFLRPRNVHHWGYTENDQAHLWMGDTCLRFGFVDDSFLDRLVATRARQKFNHIRGLVLGTGEDAASAFPAPGGPNIEYFRRLDRRIRTMNQAGIVADLILAGGDNQLTRMFPTPQARERYVRYVVARYAGMDVTWQGIAGFEDYEGGRELLREIGTLLRKLDPYNHPRSTDALVTSAPLAGDGWMNFIVHRGADVALGAIEHQLQAAPFVNAGFGVEDAGPAAAAPGGVSVDDLRKRLWTSAMNGQYPTFANAATYAGAGLPVDPGQLESPGARQMTVWFDFFSGTRHWELEPYFDVDGGRALALEIPRSEDEPPEGIEYIVYVEKPGPVEIVLQRQNYDVAWLNPITGERLTRSRFRGDRLRIDPPDTSHDWVLHVSREERKRGLLRSYKFETHTVRLQEVEQNAQRVPFEIAEPSSAALSAGQPSYYAAKVTRETRATRSMLWLWTAEVSTDGQGYRFIGSGQEGTLRVPGGIAFHYPAILNLRLAGMNANGKVYFLDKVLRLER
ncbi:MAG: DUF5060 domain-containing protein [Bryobacterales bacterium]|nr:DUF5060 domain-containing protein [Bryobacterales bacterium]